MRVPAGRAGRGGDGSRSRAVSTVDTRKLAASRTTAEAGADGRDQDTAEARTGDLSKGLRSGELGVALDQVLSTHQYRQKGLVGDVEEDREDRGHQGDDVQLQEGEHSQQVGERYRRQDHRPEQVRPHQHALGTPAVHQCAGLRGDDQKGGAGRTAQFNDAVLIVGTDWTVGGRARAAGLS